MTSKKLLALAIVYTLSAHAQSAKISEQDPIVFNFKSDLVLKGLVGSSQGSIYHCRKAGYDFTVSMDLRSGDPSIDQLSAPQAICCMKFSADAQVLHRLNSASEVVLKFSESQFSVESESVVFDQSDTKRRVFQRLGLVGRPLQLSFRALDGKAPPEEAIAQFQELSCGSNKGSLLISDIQDAFGNDFKISFKFPASANSTAQFSR